MPVASYLREKSSVSWLTLLSLAFVLVTFHTRTLHAQESPPLDVQSSEWQFGFDLFQMLFRQRGLEVESNLSDVLYKSPEKGVIVLTGDIRSIPYRTLNDLRRFLDKGGSVLIASDRLSVLSQLCIIESGPNIVSEEAAFQGYTDCPLITDINDDHRLTLGVQKIVANRCGSITNYSKRHGDWTTIARLPDSLVPIIAALESSYARGGRLVVAADHSLFINGMLWHGDNALLAVNISNWLCEGERTSVVFVNDSQTSIGLNLDDLPPESLPDADSNLPENMPDLPAKSLLTFANSFLTGLEDANVLNDMAAGQPKKMADRYYHRGLLVGAAIIVALITLYKLLNRGPLVPLPTTRASAPLISQRLQDIKNSDDLRPLSQEVAVQLMQTLTGSDDKTEWIIKSNQVEVSSSVRKQKQIKQDIERISHIATDVEKFPLTSWDFDQLAKKILRLETLHAQGDLQVGK